MNQTIVYPLYGSSNKNIPENKKLLAHYRFYKAYLYRCYQKED